MSYDLSRPILIHVCKDKTLTYRNRQTPIFNKVAIPVFSVNSIEEAEALILLVGRKQYEDHPLIVDKPYTCSPDRAWYRITLDPPLDWCQYLEYFDLPEVADKLTKAYNRLRSAK